MEFNPEAKDIFDVMNLTLKESTEIGDFLADTYEEHYDEEDAVIKSIKITYEKFKGKFPDFTLGFLFGSFMTIRMVEIEKIKKMEELARMLEGGGIFGGGGYEPEPEKKDDCMYR